MKVTRDRLHDSFLSGAKDHQDLWKKVLSSENWEEVQKLKKKNCEEFHYSSHVWAHTLFDFAVAYRSADFDRVELLNALMPFYFARTLSFVNKTRDMDSNEAEGYLERVSRVFEEEKYYLVQRWDQSLKEHGVAKVADLLASGSSD